MDNEMTYDREIDEQAIMLSTLSPQPFDDPAVLSGNPNWIAIESASIVAITRTE